MKVRAIFKTGEGCEVLVVEGGISEVVKMGGVVRGLEGGVEETIRGTEQFIGYFVNLDIKVIFDDSSNNKTNGTVINGPQLLASKMYQLSPHEDLSLAMLLLRPNRSYGDQELLREKTSVTKDNYGTVDKVYVVCQQDKLLKLDFQLSMIERNPTNDVKVIPKADHMVMFSKPQELFACLQEIADTYY
ncbi:methyl jasmonate esterase 1 [Lathyrus oleraceus]|uniref:methyl jasmonate esterase 1 n=1 Tax=Pisum sativum TaxID=3888 RepID=UPI0021CF14BC|nr:methyl jasmonate esterase 1-like [Pisum sativum]